MRCKLGLTTPHIPASTPEQCFQPHARQHYPAGIDEPHSRYEPHEPQNCAFIVPTRGRPRNTVQAAEAPGALALGCAGLLHSVRCTVWFRAQAMARHRAPGGRAGGAPCASAAPPARGRGRTRAPRCSHRTSASRAPRPGPAPRPQRRLRGPQAQRDMQRSRSSVSHHESVALGHVRPQCRASSARHAKLSSTHHHVILSATRAPPRALVSVLWGLAPLLCSCLPDAGQLCRDKTTPVPSMAAGARQRVQRTRAGLATASAPRRRQISARSTVGRRWPLRR